MASTSSSARVLRVVLSVVLTLLVIGLIPDSQWTSSEQNYALAVAEAEAEETDGSASAEEPEDAWQEMEPESEIEPENDDGFVYKLVKTPLLMLFCGLLCVAISHHGSGQKLHPWTALPPYVIFLVLLLALPDLSDDWTPDPYKTVVAAALALVVHTGMLFMCTVKCDNKIFSHAPVLPTNEGEAAPAKEREEKSELMGVANAVLAAQLAGNIFLVYQICASLNEEEWYLPFFVLSLYPFASVLFRLAAMHLAVSPDKKEAVEIASLVFAAVPFRWFYPDFTNDDVFVSVHVYLFVFKLIRLFVKARAVDAGSQDGVQAVVRNFLTLQFADVLSTVACWFLFLALDGIVDISPMHFEWSNTAGLDDALDRLWLLYGVALLLELFITAVVCVVLGQKRDGGASQVWADGIAQVAKFDKVLVAAFLTALITTYCVDGRRTLIVRDVTEAW